MAETATPMKPKKIAKKTKPAEHPTYAEMIAQAIVEIGDKKGSSAIAIKKYILSHFRVEDNKATNGRINMALKRGVTEGKLITARGHAGTFKAAKAEKAATKKAPAKKTPAKKTPKKAVKSPQKVAKPAAKKLPLKKKTPKKAAKPKAAVTKKPAAKKTPKKAGRGRPAKAKK